MPNVVALFLLPSGTLAWHCPVQYNYCWPRYNSLATLTGHSKSGPKTFQKTLEILFVCVKGLIITRKQCLRSQNWPLLQHIHCISDSTVSYLRVVIFWSVQLPKQTLCHLKTSILFAKTHCAGFFFTIVYFSRIDNTREVTFIIFFIYNRVLSHYWLDVRRTRMSLQHCWCLFWEVSRMS